MGTGLSLAQAPVVRRRISRSVLARIPTTKRSPKADGEFDLVLDDMFDSPLPGQFLDVLLDVACERPFGDMCAHRALRASGEFREG